MSNATRSASGAKIQRAAELARRGGVRALWFAVLGELGYRRLVLLELPFDAVRPVVPEMSITIRLLAADEVAEYVRFRGTIEAHEVRRRLQAEHSCIVVRHEGTIVNAGWVAAGTGWIDYLGCALPLAADEVYTYDVFTTLAFRSRGLSAAREGGAAALLRPRGFRRSVVAVLPENAPAFRPLERAGYRRTGWIGVIRLGRWQRIVGTTTRGRPSTTGARAGTEPDYWDRVLDDFRRPPAVDPWRAYMRRVYRRLIAEWLSTPAAGPALKTDLFEEAITPEHVLGELGPGSVGVDTSPAIVRAARTRLGAAYHFVVADLRHLPFRSGCVGRILAGSSLDHFPESRDIDVCLAELARILTPGGVLVVTFDNPANPVVRLRNGLPFAWLQRLGIVPYYVGATYGFDEAARALAAVGLRVTARRAVAHAPRVPAMWLAALAHRLPARLASFVENAIDRCEALERLPTRDRTAYYVALRAVKD